MQSSLRALGALVAVSAWLGGCVSVADPELSLHSRTEARWGDGPTLDGAVQTSFERGALLVWGTVEAPHLRRGQVIGHANVDVLDAEGRVWRTSRANYREPVTSDPPSAAAIYCARIDAEPPTGWRVVVTHHPRVFDAR
ncbi:MAG: hypothetical protein IPJ77_24325 [Planctomycetes bacterium]|nr:hypothetical protein [Planctomycetota bacterium]